MDCLLHIFPWFCRWLFLDNRLWVYEHILLRRDLLSVNDIQEIVWAVVIGERHPYERGSPGPLWLVEGWLRWTRYFQTISTAAPLADAITRSCYLLQGELQEEIEDIEDMTPIGAANTAFIALYHPNPAIRLFHEHQFQRWKKKSLSYKR
jgi:hypothetical protein